MTTFRLNSLEELAADVKRNPDLRMLSFYKCLMARVLGDHYSDSGFRDPRQAARAIARQFGISDLEAYRMFVCKLDSDEEIALAPRVSGLEALANYVARDRAKRAMAEGKPEPVCEPEEVLA